MAFITFFPFNAWLREEGIVLNYISWQEVQCICLHYPGDHDDVIKWKHFPRYWPFVRGIHRSPVNSPHKGQWRGALMFSLNCARINGWVNNCAAGDLRRNHAHYDVTVMDVRSLTVRYCGNCARNRIFQIWRAVPIWYEEVSVGGGSAFSP